MRRFAAQFDHVRPGRRAEQAAVFAAEMGRTFVTHPEAGGGRFQPLTGLVGDDGEIVRLSDVARLELAPAITPCARSWTVRTR